MKNENKKLNVGQMVLLLVALSACGKNMAVGLKATPAAGTTPGQTNTLDNSGTKVDPATGLVTTASPSPSASPGASPSASASPTATPDANASPSPSASPGDPNSVTAVEGQLAPFSKYDVAQAKNLPFTNADSEDSAVVQIGSPAFTTDEATPTGFVEESNVVFRSVNQIPPQKDAVKEVTQMTLTLKGLRRFNKAGADVKTLAKQLLCILPNKICSGDVVATTDADYTNLNQTFMTGGTADSKDDATFTGPLFSLLDVSKSSVTLDSGDLIDSANDSVDIDLFTAFGIDKTNTQAVMDWIYANTTAYSDATTGFRKFSFVMGNNTYADSGTLKIDFTWNSTDDMAKFAAKMPNSINGADDDAAAVSPSPDVKAVKKNAVAAVGGAVNATASPSQDDVNKAIADGLNTASAFTGLPIGQAKPTTPPATTQPVVAAPVVSAPVIANVTLNAKDQSLAAKVNVTANTTIANSISVGLKAAQKGQNATITAALTPSLQQMNKDMVNQASYAARRVKADTKTTVGKVAVRKKVREITRAVEAAELDSQTKAALAALPVDATQDDKDKTTTAIKAAADEMQKENEAKIDAKLNVSLKKAVHKKKK